MSVDMDNDDVNVHEFVNFNWGDGKERQEYVPVAEDAYLLEAVDAERNSSQSGNPQLKVTWEIVSGKDGQATEFDGRRLYSWYREDGEQKALKRFLYIIGEYSNKGYAPKKILGKRIFADVVQTKSEYVNAQSGETESRTYCNVRNEATVE